MQLKIKIKNGFHLGPSHVLTLFNSVLIKEAKCFIPREFIHIRYGILNNVKRLQSQVWYTYNLCIQG